MKLKELLEEVKQQIEKDKKEEAKQLIKRSLLEIDALYQATSIAKEQLEDLLKQDLSDV